MRYLWQWLPAKDQWLLVVPGIQPERAAITLRGYKRRNPRGTRFRWTDSGEVPPRKFRRRMAKEQ